MKHKEQIVSANSVINNSFAVFSSDTSKDMSIAFQLCDFYEMLLFSEGNADFCIDGNVYQTHHGDIFFTNSTEFCKASVKNGNIYKGYVLQIHPSFIKKLSAFLENDLSLYFSANAARSNNVLRCDKYSFDKLISLLKALPSDNEVFQASTNAVHKCIVAQILVMVNDIYHQKYTDVVIANEKINDIIFYINNNLCCDLSLNELSKRFYISKYHLTRQFSKHTGLSLHKFILTKRLNNAKILISEGKTPYAAAFESGFNNYSHFSKVFKASYGSSPRNYSTIQI